MSAPEEELTIEKLERLTYAGQSAEALRILIHILHQMDCKHIGLTDPQTRDDVVFRSHWLNRLAGAITALLSNPKLELDQTTYPSLMAYKRFIGIIFMATEYQSTDHLAALAGHLDGEGRRTYRSEAQIQKLLLSVSLETPQERYNTAGMASGRPSALSVPFWISLLEQEIVMGREENELRNRISQLAPEIETGYVLPDSLWVRASNAWMLSSYFDEPKKHAVKVPLNRLFHDWGRHKGIADPPVKLRQNAPGRKPVLTVLNEAFTSNHAMFRCHAPRIESLREHFHTICISPEQKIDEAGSACFDETITFPEDEHARKTAGRIIKTRPDMLYYPCLGMHPWTITMAQFRFAPIQFMSMGMPATSMASEMDYAIVREGDPVLHSEKLITGAPGKFVPHPGKHDFTKLESGLDGVLVAVAAKNHKINNRLLEACHQIRRRAATPVHFWFFPNCGGIRFEAFRRELSRHIDAECFPSTDYTSYINRLRRCDFALNPFPFGNANGIVDCAQIGLPFVCLDGPELHSRGDLIFSEQIGYPAFLRAETLEDYIAAATRLADDEGLRNEIINEIGGENRVQRMFEPEPDEHLLPLGETVWHLYQLHEQLKADKKRCFDVQELQSRAEELPGSQSA